jgi:hypothetical protein
VPAFFQTDFAYDHVGGGVVAGFAFTNAAFRALEVPKLDNNATAGIGHRHLLLGKQKALESGSK